MSKEIIISSDYKDFIINIKSKIKISHIKAYRKVNYELIFLYFEIGKIIYEKIELAGWGAKIIEKISEELQNEFGKKSGYGIRNLKYFVKFYKIYKDNQIMQQLVAQIPWGQNIVILDKCKTEEEREFYIKLTIEKGLSRNILIHQIEGGAFLISKKEVKTNFDLVIPEESDLVKGFVKDNYILSFLGIKDTFNEKELENKILENIKQFLLEIGGDFCFIGNQYKVSLGEKDYFIDLLFYNRTLKCLFAIELKIGEFKPEYTGKMDFYLSLLDKQIKKEDENPSVGIILCREKDNLIVEVALQNASKPVAIATYEISKRLEERLGVK